MKILKRLLFLILTPILGLFFIILFFGGILTYPIYWVITGKNDDDYTELLCGYFLKFWHYCKLDDQE